MRTLLISLAMLGIVGEALAQDKIPEVITLAKKKYADQLRAARELYDRVAAKAAETAIRDLVGIAAQAGKNGDLASAVTVWKEVLRIDREHVEARRQLKTFGQLEIVLKSLEVEEGGAPKAPELNIADPIRDGVVLDGEGIDQFDQKHRWRLQIDSRIGGKIQGKLNRLNDMKVLAIVGAVGGDEIFFRTKDVPGTFEMIWKGQLSGNTLSCEYHAIGERGHRNGGKATLKVTK